MLDNGILDLRSADCTRRKGDLLISEDLLDSWGKHHFSRDMAIVLARSCRVWSEAFNARLEANADLPRRSTYP